MKQPWEWTEDDILALIQDGVKESIDLEYKGCGSLEKNDNKKNEISKDISAFANSAGGTIIYGIIENNHLPIQIDVGYDPLDISKEWLEQIINSRIQRKIDGVKINQIEIPKTTPGKVIYVVYVPQSNRAPHMASDNKYYKRYNFQSVAMEDYEVRDIMRRQETPDLQLGLYLNPQNCAHLSLNTEQTYSDPIEINMSITNNASMPAEYFIIHLFIDSRLRVVYKDQIEEYPDETHANYEGEVYPVRRFSLKKGVPGFMPVWEGVRFRVCDNPMKISFPKEPGKYLFTWIIKSPRMTDREGYCVLVSDGGIVVISSNP